VTEPGLTDTEIRRYSRQLSLAEVGLEGQHRLKDASVLLIGVGGLGSPAALYLAAAGVGRLGLVDHDLVDLTNLHRQLLHDTPSVGQPKLVSAHSRIEALNPEVEVVRYETRFESANALDILRGWDLVVDGSDNFPTRYLVNDACVLAGVPFVYGAVLRFEGQASVFGVRGEPCYRCLFPEPPPPGLVPNCAEAGVLGVLPGLVGSIQATEAIKLILDEGDTLAGRLLLIDALRMEFRELSIRRDPACPVCGDEPSLTELIDYELFCGEAAVDEPGTACPEIDVTELRRRFDAGEAYQLLDVREGYELGICSLESVGAHHIPLAALPQRLDELRVDEPLILMCRSGARSAQAVAYLRTMGFENAVNLAGGILAWAERVDPDMPTY
jgi:adenylyltransferase/sulfurtransferase